MRIAPLVVSATVLLALGCGGVFPRDDEKDKTSEGDDTQGTSDSDLDSGDTSDTTDSQDSGDSGDTVDTHDSGDSGPADRDGDGYTEDEDCNDNDRSVHPGAPELCNGEDDDCDGTEDEDATNTVQAWPDDDGDGYGDAGARPIDTCTVPSGYAANDDDCDDSLEDVNPAADELCDEIDNNCDGVTDGDDAVDALELYLDLDRDGFGDPATLDLRCHGSPNGLDCDDADDTEPQMADAASTATRPDGSFTAPWPTIQEAMDAADQCVVVAAGAYLEQLDFGGKNILVQSIEGAPETIVDAGGAAPVVTFASGERPGAELRGFTLTNGGGRYEETSVSSSCGSTTTCTDYYLSWCGGGLYIDGAAPTLEGLVITGSDLTVPTDYTSGNDTYTHMSFGGGVCVRNAVVELTQVDVWSNYAEDGGGLYVESGAELTISQSTVMGNTATTGAGAEVDGGTFTAANSIFAFNEASANAGGIFAADGSVELVNVVVGECQAGVTGGGVHLTGASTASVMNTIIYGADNGAGVLVAGTSTWSSSYSDVFGNTDGNYSGVTDPTGTSGNISSNPNFVSVTADGNLRNDDWSLNSTSACVNTGNPNSAFNDADGTRNDMGAYGGPNGSWP